MGIAGRDFTKQTTTLTSLAILKVDIDEGSRDYIDYLLAFTIEALSIHRPSIVTEDVAVDLLNTEFGLRIPIKAVQHAIRRLSKRPDHLIARDGVYILSEKFPKPQMQDKRLHAQQTIDRVYSSLSQFTRDIGIDPPWDAEHSSTAITSFLGNFAIDCLRTFVYNTALPKVPDTGALEHYVVGRFVREAHEKNRGLFDDFMILVQGVMYANALTCPDLQSLQQKFNTLTCYLDTPVVLSLLGLHGQADENAARELVELVGELDGAVAVFHHTFSEAMGVIKFLVDHFDDPNVTNRALRETRAGGRLKSDIILLRGNLEQELQKRRVRTVDTPKYNEEFQIDESAFRDALADEISYRGPQVLDYDVNSVRSIYVKRKGTTPVRLEDAQAVYVTSNSAFAKAAFLEGKNHNSAREISPVITDYSLANIAWLKAPLKRPSLPERETLAACYAGLQPSKTLLAKYVRTMGEMQARGEISPDDHALLRASSIAEAELMQLTMGDDEALTTRSVSAILDAAKSKLTEKLQGEHEAVISAKDAKQREIDSLLAAARKDQERRLGIAKRRSELAARTIFLVIGVVTSAALLVGAFTAGGLVPGALIADSRLARGLTTFLGLVAVIWGWWNWHSGITLREMLGKYEKAFSGWLQRFLLSEE